MESLSLLELNEEIKRCLEDNLESSYWVVAEISELKVHQKGHCYLEMVEKADDTIVAKMRATIWSYTYRNLSGWFEAITGESLKPGLKILCNAKVNFHEVFGLSLNIKHLIPRNELFECCYTSRDHVAIILRYYLYLSAVDSSTIIDILVICFHSTVDRMHISGERPS